MIPILGKTWNLIYNLEQVSWNYNVEQELTISQLDAIAQSLQMEVNTSLPSAVDPYSFGKQIARLGRLACIADFLGIPNSRAMAIANLEATLTPWLDGTNADPLLYDQTYGGIVTTDGIENSNADFGNGWYNDHHFHYGYFVYSFATIARFDPAYWTNYRPAMDAIMRDICSISTDPAFPALRHKDYFDGHSWASGLFTQGNAKNQESSSEVLIIAIITFPVWKVQGNIT
jgi:endo-1,3(4)-beta-glucanase